jgi:hypothetical protein
MKFKYLLFLFIICSACDRVKKVNVTEISGHGPIIEDSFVYYPIKDNRIIIDLDKPQKASLFDYFSNIELIPLETNDDVLIGYCEEVICYQNRYYLFDRKQYRVYVFDETGKFIFQINKRGQGPGEYTNLFSILVNPFTGNIDLTGLGNIYSYDMSGNHVKTSLRPENASGYFYNFIALKENVYVGFLLKSLAPDTYKINYYDVKENKIIHKEYEDDELLNTKIFVSLTSHTPFYEYNEKWYFYRFVDNVTYEVGVDSLTKAYTLDFGKYNYDAKKLNTMDITSLPYIINLQGQNNRYLLAYIHSRIKSPAEYVYLFHDKSTNECKYIEHFSEPVNFLPRKVTNEYVLSWCEHGALEKYVSEGILDEKNRKKFQELLDAKDEMNPVIIKYYFK